MTRVVSLIIEAAVAGAVIVGTATLVVLALADRVRG